MKQIHITRDSSDSVNFETVSIDNTETVFFLNKDPKQPHKPSILQLPDDEQLGPAPSPPSSQVPVPLPTPVPKVPFKFPYTCQVPGHEGEKGLINVFPILAAVANTKLQATKGQATNQLVVIGGMPPYTITGLIVNNVNVPGSSTGPTQKLPIGPGLELSQDSNGISVVGVPTQVDTYNFTFTVDDSMGRNLQQVPYTLTVS